MAQEQEGDIVFRENTQAITQLQDHIRKLEPKLQATDIFPSNEDPNIYIRQYTTTESGDDPEVRLP